MLTYVAAKNVRILYFETQYILIDIPHQCKYTVSQENDTDVAHYNFNAHYAILVFLAEMLLSEYAIEQRFVIPPLEVEVIVCYITAIFLRHSVVTVGVLTSIWIVKTSSEGYFGDYVNLE